MPPPHPKRRQPTQSHRTRHRGRRADRQGRHPRRDRRGTQGQPGQQAQPERGQDRRQSRRSSAGTLGRSDGWGDGGTGQDPQTVRATQSRWDAAEGTATTADADRAQRGTESRRRGFSCAAYINLTLRQYERTGNGKTLPKDGNIPAGGVLENASIYVVQVKQSRLMPIV